MQQIRGDCKGSTVLYCDTGCACLFCLALFCFFNFKLMSRMVPLE